MTVRRVVALAQALAMILLLAPGPHHAGPSPALAAVAQPGKDTSSSRAFAATGAGIGCQAGTTRYKGPKEPTDPPWPPGAEPTPSPQPSAEPSASASALASPEPSVDPVAAAATSDGATALLSARGVRVAQAEPSAEPTAELTPDPVPSIIPDDANAPRDAGVTSDDAAIAPDVPTSPETAGRGRDLGLVSGIDVSHHNGDIDYDKVRSAGNEFVFIKATQDNDFIDPMFLTNMARARQAGLAVGGYHFFDYTLDGRDQADHFVDRLELAGGIDGALPPVVDVECWPPVGSSIHAVSTARLRDFVARVYERTGRLPIIYTSVHMWKQVVGNADGFEALPLWAACWGCDAPPSIAPGWDGWDFWQTGVGRVPGVGRLDANYYGGSPDDLAALRLRPLTIAAGAPATARSQVELDLGGRDATHLRTSPDGETWSDWSVIRGTPRATIGTEEGTQTLQVQLRSGPGLVSPVFSDSITLDRTGPQVSPPTIRLRVAALGSDPESVPVEAAWEAVDMDAGLSDASLEVVCGRDFSTRSEAPGSAAPGRSASWTVATTLLPAASCEVTVISRDGVGNVDRASAGGIETAILPVEGSSRVTASVAGDQVGIIARRGPDMGRAAVWLDGKAIGLIDLYHPTPTGPEVVYITDLLRGAAATLSVGATGSSDPAASGSSILIDAFVTLATA